MAKELVKTGEVYYRDEIGRLYLVESFQDSDGVSSGVETLIEDIVVLEPEIVSE